MNWFGLSLARVIYILIGVLNQARSLPCWPFVFVILYAVSMNVSIDKVVWSSVA